MSLFLPIKYFSIIRNGMPSKIKTIPCVLGGGRNSRVEGRKTQKQIGSTWYWVPALSDSLPLFSPYFFLLLFSFSNILPPPPQVFPLHPLLPSGPQSPEQEKLNTEMKPGSGLFLCPGSSKLRCFHRIFWCFTTSLVLTCSSSGFSAVSFFFLCWSFRILCDLTNKNTYIS